MFKRQPRLTIKYEDDFMVPRKRRLTNAWSSPREYYQDTTFNDSKIPYMYNSASIEQLKNEMSYEMLYNFVRYNEDRSLIIVDENKKIINVSELWTRQCGYSYDDVYNQSFQIMQGKDTCKETIQQFEQELEKTNKAKMNIINYSKTKEPMRCNVNCVKLYDVNRSYFDNPKFLCESIIYSI